MGFQRVCYDTKSCREKQVNIDWYVTIEKAFLHKLYISNYSSIAIACIVKSTIFARVLRGH